MKIARKFKITRNFKLFLTIFQNSLKFFEFCDIYWNDFAVRKSIKMGRFSDRKIIEKMSKNVKNGRSDLLEAAPIKKCQKCSLYRYACKNHGERQFSPFGDFLDPVIPLLFIDTSWNPDFGRFWSIFGGSGGTPIKSAFFAIFQYFFGFSDNFFSFLNL